MRWRVSWKGARGPSPAGPWAEPALDAPQAAFRNACCLERVQQAVRRGARRAPSLLSSRPPPVLLLYGESRNPPGFPGGSDSEDSALSAGDLGSIPGSGRCPGKEMATHSSTLAWSTGKPHGQRSLVGYSPWDCKESER